MLLIYLLGILGLGLVIVIHEFGHYLAARAVGVRVKSFGVGFGPALFSREVGETSYRINAIPLGGYCRFAGEEEMQEAISEGREEVRKEPGSFYAASPWRRIVVAAAGPLANLLSAVLVFAILASAGSQLVTDEPRIVIATEYAQLANIPGLVSSPAARAGLETGDRILSVDGRQIQTFEDLRERAGLAGNSHLHIRVERNGRELEFLVQPELDVEAGISRIGVFAWRDPVVAELPAINGLEPGDRVLEIAGQEVRHSLDAQAILQERDANETLGILVSRQGSEVLIQATAEAAREIRYQPLVVTEQASGVLDAIAMGAGEVSGIVDRTFRSIALLFDGVSLSRILSGPARIAYVVGAVTQSGLEESAIDGLARFVEILSLLSVALFVGNLLPIPVLDGGQILLFAAEGMVRRPIRPRAIYRYQIIGLGLVLALVGVAIFGDILFIVRGTL